MVMCLAPKYITNRTLHMDLFKPLKISVPCGKCEECKKVNRNEWFARSYFEWQRNKGADTYFYTLTYNNENLPRYRGIQHFSKRHIQLFLKRLRAQLAEYDITLKYLVCCEFGELRGRCHYHALFFLNGSINPYWFYRFVQKAWQYGFVSYAQNVGLVNSVSGIQYVTKYVTKDYSHLDVVLPKFAPMVFSRYYELYRYIMKRYDYYPACSFTMNKDYTFSRKLHGDCSQEDIDFVQKFLTKMRRILNELVPFHMQSSKLGSNMINHPNIEAEKIPILKSNGTISTYKLPRYIKRLLWYDCIEGEHSGKNDTFVLNEAGKKHLLSKLENDIQDEKLRLQKVVFNCSSLSSEFLPYLNKYSTQFHFSSIRDVVHYCQHFDLDFDVLAIYSKVFRGRICTFNADYLNGKFIKDNWYDYARACIYDTCHFDYGEIVKNYALQKTLSCYMFNNMDYFHVYEQALQLFNMIASYQATCKSYADIEKDKNVRNLRQYLQLNV